MPWTSSLFTSLYQLNISAGEVSASAAPFRNQLFCRRAARPLHLAPPAAREVGEAQRAVVLARRPEVAPHRVEVAPEQIELLRVRAHEVRLEVSVVDPRQLLELAREALLVGRRAGAAE